MSNPYNLKPPSSASLADVYAAMGTNLPGMMAPSRNKVLRTNLGWYQLYTNLVRGGRHIFTPEPGTLHPISHENIDTYLIRHEAEPEDEFRARIRDSFNLPYCREIITIFTSTLFRQEVVRDPVSDVFGVDYLADIDLQGHSVREFLRRCFHLAQQYGWVGVLTDYPRVSGAFLSAYHEALNNPRPYSQIVLPTRLWDWERDPATGHFLYAEIWNGQSGDWDEAAQVGGRWRRWYAPKTDENGQRVSGYWADVDFKGNVLDAGEHTFSRVPLDVLVCQSVESDDGLDPFGVSALVDVANIALWLYQMCSLLESHERRALFAFLHIQEDPQKYAKSGKVAAPKMQLGSSHYLWSDGNVDWVEPPSSVPREAREAILWGIQEMRRATGVATRSEESVEAHSGVALAWEYSSRHNMVYERAQNLEDFESHLWLTHAEWLGLSLPPDPIRYPREYAIQPVEQELDEVGKISALAEKWPGGIKAVLPLIRRKLRRVAIRDVGHMPEIDDILVAIDNLGAKDDEPEVAAEDPILNGALRTSEQLVKMKAPDEMLREITRFVAERLGIASPSVLSAIADAKFRWYTEEQAAISALGTSAEDLPPADESDEAPEERDEDREDEER